MYVCEMQLQRETDVLSYINHNYIEHQYEMCVITSLAVCYAVKLKKRIVIFTHFIISGEYPSQDEFMNST